MSTQETLEATDPDTATDEELEAMDEDADEIEPIKTNLDADGEPLPAKTVEQSDAEDKLARIISLNAEVSLLHHAHLIAAESAKEKKKAWESASERLQSTIRGFSERYPLFDREKPQESSSEPAKAVADESWREVDIDILVSHGLSESIAEKLEENGIATIGDLADLTREHGDRWRSELKGIGEAKAEKIDAAFSAFWAANPQHSDKTPQELHTEWNQIAATEQAEELAEHLKRIDAEANGITSVTLSSGDKSVTLNGKPRKIRGGGDFGGGPHTSERGRHELEAPG